MSQYFLDPNDWTVGDNLATPGFPFEVIARGGGVSPVVEVRNDGTSNYFYVETGASGRHLIAFSDVPDSVNIEIWAQQSAASTDSAKRICVRGYTSDGTVDGSAYYYQHRSLSLDKIVAGSMSSVGGAASWDEFVRFRCQGASPTTLENSTWATTEPADFEFTTTDSDASLQSAGKAGLAPFEGNIRYYGVGVGTNGDSAPSEPVPEPTPSVTVTQTELTPGGTISGTYADYDTIPTTLTVSDGTNTITIASPTITDNGDGTGSFSGMMPALPTTGTANLVLFGDVTVELT